MPNAKITPDELRQQMALQRPVRAAVARLTVSSRTEFDADLDTLVRAIEVYVQAKKELKNVDA